MDNLENARQKESDDSDEKLFNVVLKELKNSIKWLIELEDESPPTAPTEEEQKQIEEIEEILQGLSSSLNEPSVPQVEIEDDNEVKFANMPEEDEPCTEIDMNEQPREETALEMWNLNHHDENLMDEDENFINEFFLNKPPLMNDGTEPGNEIDFNDIDLDKLISEGIESTVDVDMDNLYALFCELISWNEEENGSDKETEMNSNVDNEKVEDKEADCQLPVSDGEKEENEICSVSCRYEQVIIDLSDSKSTEEIAENVPQDMKADESKLNDSTSDTIVPVPQECSINE